MAESDLVRRIIRAAKARFPRAFVCKLADRHTRGLPDILIVFPLADSAVVPGVSLFVETKTYGGKLSAIQEVTHDKLRDAGGMVLVAREVARVIDTLLQLGAVP